MSTTQQQPSQNRGIVKQVLSGDTVIIRAKPKGGPPPEKQLSLANINAPKLARRANPPATQSTPDEPYAWEAREFLRKKLIGKEVSFTKAEVKNQDGAKLYGNIFLGKDSSCENIAEAIVSEGLVKVRTVASPNEQHQKLIELETAAKNGNKGLWEEKSNLREDKNVRDVKWTIESPHNFVDSLQKKPVKAIVEHVRDGSTVRLILLPDFYYITVMLSGIRCPAYKVVDNKPQDPEPFAEEARFFTECRLLQREVEVILESASNQNYFGTILHPNGNIAELLLKEGFARCVDWSITFVSTGAEKLRAAERIAKEKRLRIWKDYTPGPAVDAKDKEFQGKVIEVINADALMIKLADGTTKKVFLASIRPPRLADDKQAEIQKDNKGRSFRPLYDVPHMFEAREFLRKKLIGKKVHVIVDYIQPASATFPEKVCCTVTVGGMNVADALVSKGLATVVRYRQDDDQRSSHYDELLAAEIKAQKSGKGLHSKKETPVHRVVDLSGDQPKAKQYFPFLQRASRMEGIVEFVASGSRLRIYIPKENCLITFLLAGINCPRATRPGGGGIQIEGEPWGEEALQFTKELCLQREVEIEVEAMDKAGNFIGWLWIESNNLSVALVQEGLATVHFTAEHSAHGRALQVAEDAAKKRRDKIWLNFEEPKEQEVKNETLERKVNYKSVVVTEVRPDLMFYAQHVDDGPKLEEILIQLRQEFSSSPPLPGAYTPKKGEMCAALFSDEQWYRARVEKAAGNIVHIFYVDYGNKEVTEPSKLASLPHAYKSLPHAAHEYGLACTQPPKDMDYIEDARTEFFQLTGNRKLLMNIEYKAGSIEYVTLLTSDEKDDIGMKIISEGLLLVENRKEKWLQKLISEYKAAEETARRKRLNIWCYGDFTDDDAKEFGYQ